MNAETYEMTTHTMISLNVGPSHIAPAVAADIFEITRSGLLAESHRGAAVMNALAGAVEALRAAMRVPVDYEVFFQPSATAAMSLALRNCVARSSFHFVQGAFSKRWAETAEQIGLVPQRSETGWDEIPRPEQVEVAGDVELIAVTHCETSTGVMWPANALQGLRARYPDPLLAVDVTSTFGAMDMDWRGADIWFGSVQKCVGLPAGLGYALIGPRAMAKAEALGAARRVAAWQDVLHMKTRIAVGQTVETPNVLGIALLERQMRRRDIERVERETRAKAAHLRARFGDHAFHVREPDWRSITAHSVRVEDPAAWIARAAAAGHRLGAGYGPLKATCIRIATYPAVSIEQIDTVLDAAMP